MHRFACSTVALFLVACTESHRGPDAAPPVDAPIATCGADLDALRAELGEGLTPVAHLCTALADGPMAAHVGDEPGRFVLWHARLERSADASTSTAVVLERHEVGWDGSDRVALTRREVYETAEGEQLRLSNDMGMGPGATSPCFGVNVSGAARAYALIGSELMGRDVTAYGGCALVADDDYGSWLVSSIEEDRTGIRDPLGRLYARTSGLGDLRHLDGDSLISAVLTGHGYVSLGVWDDITSGSPPHAPDATAPIDAWPLDFVVLEGRGLVGRATWGPVDDHMLYEVRIDGDTIPFPEPVRFASPFFTEVAPIVGSARVILRHPTGLLVVE